MAVLLLTLASCVSSEVRERCPNWSLTCGCYCGPGGTWSGIGPERARPSRASTSTTTQAPPTEIVHTLTLVSPPGNGSITLTRSFTPSVVGGWTARYAADGAISVTDAIGEWRFAYTKTSLDDTPSGRSADWIFGVHGVSIALRNTSSGTLEIDWTRSVLVDGSGHARPVLHRGVRFNDRAGTMAPSIIPAGATLDDFVFPSDQITFQSLGRSSSWIAPAVFERLVPGAEMSLTFSVKASADSVSKTFKFIVK